MPPGHGHVHVQAMFFTEWGVPRLLINLSLRYNLAVKEKGRERWF